MWNGHCRIIRPTTWLVHGISRNFCLHFPHYGSYIIDVAVKCFQSFQYLMFDQVNCAWGRGCGYHGAPLLIQTESRTTLANINFSKSTRFCSDSSTICNAILITYQPWSHCVCINTIQRVVTTWLWVMHDVYM